MQIYPISVQCGVDPENKYRLFYKCSYSSLLQNSFKQKLKLQQGRKDVLLNEITMFQQLKLTKPPKQSVTIVSGTTVWSLWQERNKRIFENETLGKHKLKKLVEELIRATTLQCISIKAASAEEELLQYWVVQI